MLPFNLPSYRTDLCLQIPILLDILPAWDSHLDQQDLILQVRVLIQKQVKPFQLLRQPFDVVQSINPNNHSHATVPLLKLLRAILHLRLPKRILELLWINPDDKRAHFNQAVFILDFIRH